MSARKRGNWKCPNCGRKTPAKYGACEHCGRSRRADTGSSYLGRHALAQMGIIVPRGTNIPVGAIKVRRKKEAKKDEKV